MYQTEVINLGQDANAFAEEKMVILFGSNAPAELEDYCYIINVNPVEEDITETNKLIIDDQTFEITKVGNAVNKNLNNLGHITLKFDGSTEAEQSGTLYLEDTEVPFIGVGSKITIK
ncbi:PTS sorbitol transporter subunit IIA [Staphylococcus condimenti]|uniref:PTS glucitol/sorbitol transporter subunit IIA n=1 Tax=Staphylococcus condimenti TaxID=70255 RepID=A0AB37H9I8_9STAP|nr:MULTISPECIES: PTS glucitol/sorbitol transporter subunit IIA [Staphylococcus]AMY05974.1 PTS sorbitol transporter subunit IIA [Staphylococcus condimenti]APR59836.1 PTS sorbitol transporter subunit IIA [Staphylococcus condimenti]MDK8644965.1 PTS glucitol/sorbitol transporter subunit IIA [Staphylococcus condimenti]OFP02992.1 PTS sorbitol transporter subunit IIA [Staphylococcus sp. HMSC065E08]PNZ57219.1 PTS sorbitol transporter subunit IIA [Staphylococcus condimenti]